MFFCYNKLNKIEKVPFMKISNVIMQFLAMYIGGAVILSIIMTAIGMQSSTVFTVLLVMFIVRYLVSEYMKDHQRNLTDDEYWKIFFSLYGITLIFEGVVSSIVFSQMHIESSILMIAIVTAIVMNGAAVFAGLYHAKKVAIKANYFKA